MIEIIEGSDEVLNFELTASDGIVIDINDLNNIEIKICDGEVYKRYKLNGATAGEGVVNVDDAEAGKVNIIIDRDFTTKWVNKKFDIIIKLFINASGDFKNNIRVDITEFERFIKIEKTCK